MRLWVKACQFWQSVCRIEDNNIGWSLSYTHGQLSVSQLTLANLVFYGWQTVLTLGNHTDTEITSALWLYCHSYFSSTRLPGKPLHRYADSANYFKISGRQFKFQLKIGFCSDLRGCIATGLRSQSLKVWMHYLTRNLKYFFTLKLANMHAEITLVVTEACRVYLVTHLTW